MRSRGLLRSNGGRSHPKEDDRRDSERLYEIEMDFIHRWESNLKHADPLAQIVELPGAHHYMFQNEEADLLRHMRLFLRVLN